MFSNHYDDLSKAAETADALRDRLVRAAYGLHFSCAGVAQLLEARADATRKPTRLDLHTEAKRWRAASEQAMDVVRQWDSSSRDDDVEIRRRGTSDPRVDALGELVVQEVFRVGLMLQAVQPLSDDIVGARLTEAVVALDALIDQVRHAAFSESAETSEGGL